MEIPVLRYYRTVGTRWDKRSRKWKSRIKHVSGEGGKAPFGKVICDEERNKVAKELKTLPRKAAIVNTGPVPKTDTGG